jgi:hypothetical protein
VSRVVLYNPEKNLITIADCRFWRKNIYREIHILSKKSDMFLTYGKYLSEKKWVYIGQYY